MKIDYLKTVIITIIVVFTTINAGFAVGQALTNFEYIAGPAILSLGDDEAIQVAIKEIRDELPNIRVIEINDYNTLQKVFPRHSKYLFYVGHGETSGLQVGFTLVPWDDINNLAASYRGLHQFFVSCYSDQIAATGRTTFSGHIDAVVAANIAVTMSIICNIDIATSENVLPVVSKINEIIDLENSLSEGKTSAIPLTTESGYDFAIMRVHYVDYWWGIPIRHENALYVNMAAWVTSSLISGGGLVAGLLAGKIAFAIETAGAIVAGLSTALVAVIFAAFLLLAIVSLLWNMDRRGGHDSKVGLGAQILPVPLGFIRWDNTYNREGGDYTLPILNPAIIGSIFYLGLLFGLLPNRQWIGVSLP